MIELIAIENFYAAENGLNTKQYTTDEIVKTDNKEFADILIAKGHAKVYEGLETKIIEPKETKTLKTAKRNKTE